MASTNKFAKLSLSTNRKFESELHTYILTTERFLVGGEVGFAVGLYVGIAV
jgi:hypothetical protein